MVFTLHRYIFRELLKIFVPTALALAVIMSLGSILRPVQEYGVGPRQVMHLMIYFLPITLTFVLPMAALFTGALVYGRFAGGRGEKGCVAVPATPPNPPQEMAERTRAKQEDISTLVRRTSRRGRGIASRNGSAGGRGGCGPSDCVWA